MQYSTSSVIDRLYIEFESRLTALKVFLHDLPGDPGARPFLLVFFDGLRRELSAEQEQSPDTNADDSPLRQELRALHQALIALPEDGSPDSAAWLDAHRSHQRCELAFSRFRRSRQSIRP